MPLPFSYPHLVRIGKGKRTAEETAEDNEFYDSYNKQQEHRRSIIERNHQCSWNARLADRGWRYGKLARWEPSASSPASPPPARRTWATTSARSGPRWPRAAAPASQSFYFLADYHALIKCTSRRASSARRWRSRPAGWPAGWTRNAVRLLPPVRHPRDPRAHLAAHLRHRQGPAQPRPRLQGRGRHAIAQAGEDPDADVTAGLFMYPVLMAADILMFNAHKVPVGRDQVQHIEMARDIAQRFNHLYGEHFVLPEAAIDEQVATLPGLDGRKMSKSYDNTIPLFAPREQLQQADRRHRHRLARARRAEGDRRARRCSRSTRRSRRRRRPRRCARPTPTASAGATPSSCCSSASTARSRRCASATTR